MYIYYYETSFKSWKRYRCHTDGKFNAVDNSRTMEKDLLTSKSFGENSLQQGF